MQLDEDMNQVKQIAPDTTVFSVYGEILAYLEALDNLNGPQTD